MAKGKRGNSTYPVGYKRPPRTTRFKPGVSGNPKGRPKGAKSLTTAVNKELRAKVDVTENGKHKRITKQQALVKHLVNKAAGGDPKALPLIVKLTASGEDTETETREAEDVFDTATDREVIASVIERFRLFFATQSAGDASTPPSNDGATDSAATPQEPSHPDNPSA